MSFCYRAPADIITAALAVLGRIATVSAVSRLYRSPAWPDPADPAFINAAARIESGLAPAALLAALHAVEAGFGRRRGPRNAPRTLDLDLLDYHGE
ncbi:MAG TPA: 2-amino-4-hydroxy-6-hydroxymethyldihydropteridine diphosphokinase, partial [Parvularculaceae bacterium]|nr:2-amino-4-hydroxy-6-hydroxymethyldihydropteridine diphosphokinase [Parvularculaceae bacterium]